MPDTNTNQSSSKSAPKKRAQSRGASSKKPSAQPVTAATDIVPGGFSEAISNYHHQVSESQWVPHRPERLPTTKLLSKPLRVVSQYKPAGDQPTAIKELSGGLREGEWDQVLLGATGTGKTFTMAKVIEEMQRPALILAPNKTLACLLYTSDAADE